VPPPDKIRPLVTMGCTHPDCDFHTTQEWAGLLHEDQHAGHRMDWWQPKASAL
jgi:hypothetical protein